MQNVISVILVSIAVLMVALAAALSFISSSPAAPLIGVSLGVMGVAVLAVGLVLKSSEKN